MEAKLFEIRDRATFIPVLAVSLEPECQEDRYLLSRAGFGSDPEYQASFVTLIQINGGEGSAYSDPYAWTSRTYSTAHRYITENFQRLQSGAVVDVEVILGEKGVPSVSERISDS